MRIETKVEELRKVVRSRRIMVLCCVGVLFMFVLTYWAQDASLFSLLYMWYFSMTFNSYIEQTEEVFRIKGELDHYINTP